MIRINKTVRQLLAPKHLFSIAGNASKCKQKQVRRCARGGMFFDLNRFFLPCASNCAPCPTLHFILHFDNAMTADIDQPWTKLLIYTVNYIKW